MKNEKKYICTLDENDLRVISQLINAFPLGVVNVQQAANCNNHAQQILDFLGSKTQEVVSDTSKK